jgi:hypothetical protein
MDLTGPLLRYPGSGVCVDIARHSRQFRASTVAGRKGWLPFGQRFALRGRLARGVPCSGVDSCWSASGGIPIADVHRGEPTHCGRRISQIEQAPALVNWGCITTRQLNGQGPTKRGFSFASPRFQQPSARPASSAPAIRALTVVVPTATLRLHSSGSGSNCPCHEQAICSGGFRASGPCPWPIACACCLPRFRWPSHSRRSCTYPTATRPRGPVRPSSANSARHSIAAPRHLPQHTHLQRLRGRSRRLQRRHHRLLVPLPPDLTRRARHPTLRPDTKGP